MKNKVSVIKATINVPYSRRHSIEKEPSYVFDLVKNWFVIQSVSSVHDLLDKCKVVVSNQCLTRDPEGIYKQELEERGVKSLIELEDNNLSLLSSKIKIYPVYIEFYHTHEICVLDLKKYLRNIASKHISEEYCTFKFNENYALLKFSNTKVKKR